MIRVARALWRLLRALLHVGQGMAICAFIFPFLSASGRLLSVQRWCRGMLGLLGVEVDARGRMEPGPALIVANHVSWLDILAIIAVHPARFVSKADVRRWPVLGWLVACGGTLFIRRENKRDALRVVHRIAEALKAGDTLAIFPEGTTADGHDLLPFHANLLQAAIATGVPVQPIALRYADARSPISAAAAYVGDRTLLDSLWHVVAASGLRVSVRVLGPEPSVGNERRVLTERVRDRIGQALKDLPA